MDIIADQAINSAKGPFCAVARLLDDLMAGRKVPTEPILIPPVEVVVRQSSDFFAVDDET